MSFESIAIAVPGAVGVSPPIFWADTSPEKESLEVT